MESPALSGYSTRDVATLLGLSIEQVRSFVRDGFLSPGQGARGEYRFSFQDLILLRTAKGLLAARVPHRRIRLALRKLNEQLPEGRPLSGVRISARGSQVVVRDGGEVWDPESGQALFDFEVAELAREAASIARREREEPRKPPQPEQWVPETADEWYEVGCDLEDDAPEEAMEAYRRALQLNPDLPDAHLNLGRMLHERSEVGGAEMHYRLALGARPDDATAAYNLGVALQDQERFEEAAHAYRMALTGDDNNADAHFNLAVVYEKLGDRQSAFQHLKTYKTLTGKAS
ncbi:MAG TPA: tetratricopeptide repeat protein [Thermoanaerobaculia bacterium]|nr:tetratricopeptide repeat protein [Thermoanaerobaculia bacterium]